MFKSNALSALLLAIAQLGDAFQIHGSMVTLTRLDPIVNPGSLSSHAHMVIGGSNFGPTLTSEILEDSQCSSLETQQDKSAYWVSPPYGQNSNGTWSALPVTSVSIYYKKVKNAPIVPFPENFRMLIGNPSATEKNMVDPFMSYQCQNFIPQGDPTGQWNFSSGWERLPTMDCSRIKMATTFPNCWDGVNVDTPNHRDHVHNDLGDGVTCPPTHPKRIPQVTLEIDFWANDYKWQNIALSSGSKSGWGIHADYYFGWKDKGALLNKALNDPTCIEAQGILPGYPADKRCETLVPYADLVAMDACTADMNSQIAQEEVGIQRAIPELPGCNPRFDAPGYPATKPACTITPPTPKIGHPSRLFSWWDKDPRHVKVPRKMAVYDGFNPAPPPATTLSTLTRSSATKADTATTKKTTTTTTKAAEPTGPASGTMFLTTGQNWDSSTSNWSWSKGACKTLTSPFNSNVGSAGPSAGTCTFFDDKSCAGNTVLTMTYPGKSNLGSTGKKFKSFWCK